MSPRLDLSALVRLQALRRAAGGGFGAAPGPAAGTALTEVTDFGPNPGALRMWVHVPPDLPRGAPLVVALHGCTQTAAGFDLGCGWSDIASRSGFALVMPEQQRANNAQLCFNWFEPGDTARDGGEALSVRGMVAAMVERHGLDPARVFVAGLSAGGAMTAVMLAAYPEVFAAGAVVAGLPYGSARNVPEALSAMSQPAARPARARGDAVRGATIHRGPWPRVAVWHGEADRTVTPANAGESVKQWLDLHGLADAAAEARTEAPNHRVRAWRDAAGRVAVEEHRIAGMAHGVPLRPGRESGECGRAGPYLLDVGVSSTHEILRFWGLPVVGAAMPVAEPMAAERPVPGETGGLGTGGWGLGGAMPGGRPGAASEGPGAVIARALKAAGLMRD